MLVKFLHRLLTHVSISLLFFLVTSGLQNDHKALMKEIEQGIHEIHAKAREQKEKEKEDLDEKSIDGLYLSAKIYVTFTYVNVEYVKIWKYVNWPCIIIKNNIVIVIIIIIIASLRHHHHHQMQRLIIIKNFITYLVFFRCYIEIKSFPQSRFSSRRFSFITSSKLDFYREFQLSFARYLLLINYTGIYWKEKVHSVLF